ncbi:hypothetical protein I4U23_000805 [Adineta vaga]|nr:hypothetical protein I4U23_000805 [Adineta vaga]
MTNILFQMQKEIYRLRRRTNHIEQILSKQSKSSQPIIRIPRLTRDELSTIYVNNNENKERTVSDISDENIDGLQSITTNSIDSPSEHKDETSGSKGFETKYRSSIEITQQEQSSSSLNQKTKYCIRCQHEFSHRSGYLRHVKNIHKGIDPSIPDNVILYENENPPSGSTNTTMDQPSGNYFDMDNEQVHFLVNQWDIGEGRLRPRPAPKLVNEPATKVKCHICNKFYRAEYIKKHEIRAHHERKSSISSSNDINVIPDPIEFNVDKPVDDIQPISNESLTNNTDPPSAITIAEMDIDDMPIEFRKLPNKLFVIATTCLERYQLNLVDEFLQKFSSQVCQTNMIDSQTTHLIINDDEHPLRSPLSMKLIEAVANHCYCVSHRWIVECLRYDRLVDEARFEIEGDNTDSQPHGGPKRSRLAEKRHALFENVCFMIKCTENNDIKLSNERLQELITTCGGQIITCVTQSLLRQYTIVVLCDKLYVSERRHNYDQCQLLGIHFVSSDWVLESILEYQQKTLSLFAETPL